MEGGPTGRFACTVLRQIPVKRRVSFMSALTLNPTLRFDSGDIAAIAK